jgi:hypothetical protein
VFALDGVGDVEIRVVDTGGADRTTALHGVAWLVNNRLVGECTWEGLDGAKLLDGRSHDAKRYTVILVADALEDAVREDWSGFNLADERWKGAVDSILKHVGEILDSLWQTRTKDAKSNVRQRFSAQLQQMTPVSRERWVTFVDRAVDQCRSITEREIGQLAGILANLETSKSKYGLIGRLHELDSSRIDDLYLLLGDWTIAAAKLVLDEIQGRLRLIGELKAKAWDRTVDEVAELQPLFAQGLWMLGAEFESVEYTSNQGMTTVIRNLFGVDDPGSLLRPDFVVLPDASVGFYGRPAYDEDYNERGTERVVIVELKKPGVPIGLDQKNQVKKYHAELQRRGYLTHTTRADAFVLGTLKDPDFGSDEDISGRPTLHIRVLLYQELITRTERRMMNLHEKVKDAPFLKREEVEQFLQPPLGQTAFA